MPAFLAPVIGAVARAAAPAIARAAAPAARAAAGRAAQFVAGRGGMAAVGRQAMGVVAKTPALRAGAIGFGLGRMTAGGGDSRKENFNNWFPGSTDGDGVMH